MHPERRIGAVPTADERRDPRALGRRSYVGAVTGAGHGMADVRQIRPRRLGERRVTKTSCPLHWIACYNDIEGELSGRLLGNCLRGSQVVPGSIVRQEHREGGNSMRALLHHQDPPTLLALARRLRRAAVIVDSTTELPSPEAIVEGSHDVAALIPSGPLEEQAVLDVVRKARVTNDETPILLATTDVLEGFAAGADSCVTPDVAPEELVARVVAVSRRKPLPSGTVLQVGSLRLYPSRMEVHRDGRVIELTTKECRLLEALARHPGEVVEKEALVTNAWGESARVSDNTIAAHIRTLRRKLGPPELLLSARNYGYLLWAGDESPPRSPGSVTKDKEVPSARPLQHVILDILTCQEGARTSAQVVADLERHGWDPTTEDPTDKVQATLLALLRKGLVIRSGDKSRPRFKVAEAT